MSRTITTSEDEGVDVTPESATLWRWLDGPGELARPGTDAGRFAAALTMQVRVPLSYDRWSCVLQWRDERDEGASAETPTTRRYELSYWVDGAPPRPGARLGSPGEFVATAALSADPETSASALREAVSGLLSDAGRVLDELATAMPAAATAGTAVAAGRRPRHARRTAVARSSSRGAGRSRARRSLRRVALELALAAVVVVAGLYAAQAFVLRPYVVPSSSMASTLVRGQRVLVDRLIYRLRPVERGDIVVFRRPVVPYDVLIGRVVGVPGDVLSLRAGRVYVNGAPADVAIADPVHGVVEPTLPADPFASGDATASWTLDRPYRVPAGRYLVLGENRRGSTGSLYWGIAPRSAIIGRALLSFWPPDRIHAY